VQVLLTIGLIVAAAVWILSVQKRLARRRDEVKLVWKQLEADQANEALRTVYNKHVDAYNTTLESFPANVFGPLTGFKPARRF
jgi:hypothetical protein